jgi:uncharacterized protein (TIGR03382 family)
MRLQLSSLGVASLVAACFVSFSAQANSTGFTGRSGKQGTNCMTAGCHADSPAANAPTVQLQGPSSLQAGATGNYTLVITGGPAMKAGMNVAVSDNGGTLGPSADLRTGGTNELTHKAAKAFTNNEARFDFTLVAPATAGTVTLYASGNSTNGNGAKTGDNAVSMTMAVQVTAGTGTPDAGTGTPDAGTGGGNNGGGEDEDDGGCSAAGGAPMVLLLALVAAHLRRRRD